MMAGILGVWLGVAVVMAAAGALDAAPPAAVPLVIWGPVVALALCAARSARVREALTGIDLRVLLGYHLLRGPIGLAFLWLVACGELDPEFGLIAGWGDVAVGLLAPWAVWLAHRGRGAGVIQAINIFGLADILLVFASAQRVIFLGGGIEGLAPLRGFPGGLIPMVVVPWVLISHALVAWKLRPLRRAARSAQPRVGDRSGRPR